MYNLLLSKSFAKHNAFITKIWFESWGKNILNVKLNGKYKFDNKKWYLKKSRYSMKMNNEDVLHRNHNHNLYRMISGNKQ